MKKISFRNFSVALSKKIWTPIALTMSFIYFGSLLANRNKAKDINSESGLFAPAISLVKVGSAIVDIDAGPGCNYILYVFSVANEGDEILENVVLDDPLLDNNNVMINLTGGDDNNDGFLDTDETWTYSALYEITVEDVANGQVVNQATVTAHVQGQPNMEVSDSSESIIDLTFCQGGISLIKVGAAIEDIDAGPGCNYILYTFSVANESGQILENVVLDDPLLDGVVISLTDGDDNNDGFLDTDETWTYAALYNITADDINNGQVENRASVKADIQGQPGRYVSDLSDNDSPLEDDYTVVDLTFCQGNIGLVKIGFARDLSGGAGCDRIEYTFTVVNQGAQILETVEIIDPLLGEDPLPGPNPGSDFGNDGVMQPTEAWTYTAFYDITADDIANGYVENQATVTARVQGPHDIYVSDLSDDSDSYGDDPTVVDLSACQPGIRMIKTGQVSDCGVIEYTFAIANTSGNGQVLENVVVNDPLMGGPIVGPNPGTDQNSDGVMDPGEIWTYSAPYNIQPADILNGQIVNQATVTANVQGQPGVEASDLSDDDNIAQDEPTVVDLAHCPYPEMGLIKEGLVIDGNGDGCMDSIRYIFTVTNTGAVDLEEVFLEDPLFSGQVPGPVDGTDANDDGVLSIGETWTYEADHYIEQADIDSGSIINQAIVTGEPVEFDIQLMDLSDNDSYAENDATETIIPNDACTDGGTSIGFEIFNGITPNGDGMNDYFRIEGIENYPDNNVKIFNRWGVLVYESDNYGQDNNLFYGISEGRATLQKDRELPSGTYFYILTITGENPGKANYSGYLYINRD